MRGRLQGIFLVVVVGGPRVADVAHGSAAALVGTAAAAAGGGVLVVIGTVVAALAVPSFVRYRVTRPATARLAAEQTLRTYAAWPTCWVSSLTTLTSRAPRVTGGSQRSSTIRSRSSGPRPARYSSGPRVHGVVVGGQQVGVGAELAHLLAGLAVAVGRRCRRGGRTGPANPSAVHTCSVPATSATWSSWTRVRCQTSQPIGLASRVGRWARSSGDSPSRTVAHALAHALEGVGQQLGGGHALRRYAGCDVPLDHRALVRVVAARDGEQGQDHPNQPARVVGVVDHAQAERLDHRRRLGQRRRCARRRPPRTTRRGWASRAPGVRRPAPPRSPAVPGRRRPRPPPRPRRRPAAPRGARTRCAARRGRRSSGRAWPASSPRPGRPRPSRPRRRRGRRTARPRRPGSARRPAGRAPRPASSRGLARGSSRWVSRARRSTVTRPFSLRRISRPRS